MATKRYKFIGETDFDLINGEKYSITIERYFFSRKRTVWVKINRNRIIVRSYLTNKNFKQNWRKEK